MEINAYIALAIIVFVLVIVAIWPGKKNKA